MGFTGNKPKVQGVLGILIGIFGVGAKRRAKKREAERRAQHNAALGKRRDENSS